MATFELYRRSTIGMCLTETLDEMVSSGTLSPDLAIQVLVQFDKSMTEALDTQVKSKVSVKLASEGESANSISSMPNSGHGAGSTGSWRYFVRMGYFSEVNLRRWPYLLPEQRYRQALQYFLLVFPQYPKFSWWLMAGLNRWMVEELLWGFFAKTIVLAERFELTAETVLGGHMRELIERIKDLQTLEFNIYFLMVDLKFMCHEFYREQRKAAIVYAALQCAQDRLGSGVDSCLDAAVRHSMERSLHLNEMIPELEICLSILLR